uniref:Uncharacterized protein n=1 Tax=Romanomermis culicivorax TaxID=13658 RepID=A0A915HYP2_ROMCU
MQLTIWKMQ